MTDKEWNQLLYLRGKHFTKCKHPCGSDCTANRKGRCIALTNTLFRHGKPCPFFRDKTQITEQELKEYEDFLRSISVQERSNK